ncbi:MAG: phosphoglucosamine mutase, partial [Clostridiales bacterium]|nr:phosphoglucosamine mutase [Clostridiales bacterium]
LKTNTVVTTVMSNLGLYKMFDELEIDYLKTAVGDKYVWEAMKEGSHIIGGEQSGHIIHSDCLCTGDGLISAVKLMHVVLDEGLPVSKLHEELVIFPQVLKNVIVTDKDETLNDGFVQARVKELEAALGNCGRILLRKSGTEPVLRIMAEAETIERCNEVVDSIIDAMNQKAYLIEVR